MIRRKGYARFTKNGFEVDLDRYLRTPQGKAALDRVSGKHFDSTEQRRNDIVDARRYRILRDMGVAFEGNLKSGVGLDKICDLEISLLEDLAANGDPDAVARVP